MSSSYPVFENIQTDSPEVARIIAAHNAAVVLGVNKNGIRTVDDYIRVYQRINSVLAAESEASANG